MIDKEKFDILLIKKKKTKKQWADYLNIDVSTLYKKLSSEYDTDFTRPEIILTCEFFGEDNMDSYFFAQ